MTLDNYWSRPPIGMIVEGRGESAAFPAVVAKITKCALDVRVLPADGCGDIVKNLEDLLSDMVIVHHPYSIIITLDLGDIVGKDYLDRTDAHDRLSSRLSKWCENAVSDKRLQPLPEKLCVAFQEPKLEAWMMADVESLVESLDALSGTGYEQWTNVDIDVSDHVKWIAKYVRPTVDTKKPREVRLLFSRMDTDKARRMSQSFDVFCGSVEHKYNAWYQLATKCETP